METCHIAEKEHDQASYVGATRSAAENVAGGLCSHRLGPSRRSLLPDVINQSINQSINGDMSAKCPTTVKLGLGPKSYFYFRIYAFTRHDGGLAPDVGTRQPLKSANIALPD